MPNWSIGCEGGWFALAGDQVMVLGFPAGSRMPQGNSRGMFSASGVVRGRSPGPVRQLRWHEMIGPDDTNMDIVTFEVGLQFN